MMLPLLHHGMLVMGIPYTEPGLNATRRPAARPMARAMSPASPTTAPVSDAERALAIAQGKRLAELALKLSQ